MEEIKMLQSGHNIMPLASYLQHKQLKWFLSVIYIRLTRYGSIQETEVPDVEIDFKVNMKSLLALLWIIHQCMIFQQLFVFVNR